MARKKKEPIIKTSPLIRKPGCFYIYIEKEGNLKLIASNLTSQEYLKTYFINIEKNVSNSDITREELINKYDEIWKSRNIKSIYIDSWGHTWNNTKPSKEEINNYVDSFLQNK